MCGPGQELDTSGSSCTPCPVGTYKTFQNESACIRCPMDYTTAGTGSTSSRNCSVLYCSPGKFKTGDHCAACPVGTYQENENQSECKKCSDTRVTQYPGSDSPRDCKSKLVPKIDVSTVMKIQIRAFYPSKEYVFCQGISYRRSIF